MQCAGIIGVTVTSNFDELPVSNAAIFIIFEAVMGIVLPFLIVLSTVMGVIVARTLTHHTVHLDKLLPGFLTFLTFESGKIWSYWVIVETFYFEAYRYDKVRVRSTNGYKQHSHIITKNLATLCLSTIVAITFVLASSYFVSTAMIRITYYGNCELARLENEKSCFLLPKYTFINCSKNSSFEGGKNIICYKFLTIFHGSDIVQSFVLSLFLYIACDRFLIMLFRLAKALFSIRRTRLWAVMIMSVGTILFLLTVLAILASFTAGLNFSFLQLLQLFIISCDIILAGVLLAIGKPLQKIKCMDTSDFHYFTSFIKGKEKALN